MNQTEKVIMKDACEKLVDGKLSSIVTIAGTEKVLFEDQNIDSMDTNKLKEASKRMHKALTDIERIAFESAEILKEAGSKAGIRGRLD